MTKSYAQIAYEAYVEHKHEPLRPWPMLSIAEQGAWEKAAIAVLREISKKVVGDFAQTMEAIR
jgi:hypothetical protein